MVRDWRGRIDQKVKRSGTKGPIKGQKKWHERVTAGPFWCSYPLAVLFSGSESTWPPCFSVERCRPGEFGPLPWRTDGLTCGRGNKSGEREREREGERTRTTIQNRGKQSLLMPATATNTNIIKILIHWYWHSCTLCNAQNLQHF